MGRFAMRSYKPEIIENNVREHWKEVNAYEKTKKYWEKGEDYYFIDGPPYTTGSIHMGTTWNKVIKDLYIRYKRMRGYNVRDQPGYDMHGLPIEVKVEQTLGIKNKREIENHGIENFVEKCREFAMNFKEKMTEQFKFLGVWMDWENPYITITNEYIEAAWWTLKKAYERNLLTKAECVLTWCPRCQTALAEAEVEYWDEEDPSIYVKFPIKDRDNEYILIWTTTPWTLPADLAVTVHPNFKYVRAKMKKDDKEDILIFIKEQVDNIKSEGGYDSVEIIEEIKGEDLEGMEYIHPLLDEVPYHKKISKYWAYKLILDDSVTSENSGCVHTAPGHGPEDFEIGRRYDLPPFCPVDDNGNFTEEAGKYAGKSVRECNDEIIEDLRRKRLLMSEGSIVHRYGHCWRCKTPIIYRATTQWFLRVSLVRDKMLSEVLRVKWYPKWAGESRQYSWVENARDWCISRQRFWGIPIPIWTCECGEIKVVGSRNELKEFENYEENMNLHRPWIDKIYTTCKKCGKRMKRVTDVLDVWFDSAVCSWAQLGFPSNKKDFERWWPCEWITEAHDQTRGWFYSQLGAGVVAFERSPYDSVLMHGWALDEKGRPMSKSLGNVIDPLDVAEKYGVDSMRLYLFSASAPWEDLSFSWENVKNARRTLNILWNVVNFAHTYMELDKFTEDKVSISDVLKDGRIEDKWMFSRSESVLKDVTNYLEKYLIHKAARALEKFILDDLSRWYVKIVRDRTWIEGESRDKDFAYKSLHHALMRVAILMTPFTPYIAEAIYQKMFKRHPTVNMEEWPTPMENLINENLENSMDIVRNIVEAGSRCRQGLNIKLRWPVREVYVITHENQKNIEDFYDLLKKQLNCKNILFQKELPEGFSIVPNSEEIKCPENFTAAYYQNGIVIINGKMDDELLSEGLSRDLIRRIQEMRRDAELNVEDKIETSIECNEKFASFIKRHEDYIKNETRSIKINFEKSYGNLIKEWKIENYKVVIGIKKVK